MQLKRYALNSYSQLNIKVYVHTTDNIGIISARPHHDAVSICLHTHEKQALYILALDLLGDNWQNVIEPLCVDIPKR